MRAEEARDANDHSIFCVLHFLDLVLLLYCSATSFSCLVLAAFGARGRLLLFEWMPQGPRRRSSQVSIASAGSGYENVALIAELAVRVEVARSVAARTPLPWRQPSGSTHDPGQQTRDGQTSISWTRRTICAFYIPRDAMARIRYSCPPPAAFGLGEDPRLLGLRYRTDAPVQQPENKALFALAAFLATFLTANRLTFGNQLLVGSGLF